MADNNRTTWTYLSITSLVLTFSSVVVSLLALLKPDALGHRWTSFLVQTIPMPVVLLATFGAIVLLAWIIGYWKVPTLKSDFAEAQRERDSAASLAKKHENRANSLQAKLDEITEERTRIKNQLLAVLESEDLTLDNLLACIDPAIKPETRSRMLDVLGELITERSIEKSNVSGRYRRSRR